MAAPARVQILGPLPGREAAGERLGVALVGGDAEPAPLLVVPVAGGVARDPALLERQRRDAAAAAELVHPNVLPSFGIGEVNGEPAHLLAWVDAVPLSALLDEGGRLPPEIAARVVADACSAVQFAQDERAGGEPRLHGEISPYTLLVAASGVTLVAGLGRSPEPGTPRDRLHLLCPEQVVGGPQAVGPGSDVYLLGLALYACLAGEGPFAGEADPEAAVLGRPPPPLAPLGVPERLAAVAERALAKKAVDRWPSPGDLRRALEEAVGDPAPAGAVAAYLDLVFPPDAGPRAERRRAVEAALAAARSRPAEAAAASADELIVGEPTPPQGVGPPAPPAPAPHAASSGPAPTPASPPPPPVDLVSTADIVAEPPRPPAPDLVTTQDIVGEGSAAAIFPRPSAPSAPPRQGMGQWAVAAGIAVAGLAIGFGLARRGEDAPPPAAPPAAVPALPAAPAPTPAAAASASAAATVSAAAPGAPARAPAGGPKAAPAAAPSVEVTAEIPGDVYLDGKRIGRTPVVKDARRGRHKVRFVERSRGIDLTLEVEVTGPRTRVRVAPGKGRVTVTAPAGASIFIDGRKVATTSVRDLEVYQGNHELRVTLGSARLTERFSLRPGETWAYEASATP